MGRVKVLTPKDLEIWSNSSPYFRYLLEDQRVTFLFPKVFDILAPKYEQEYPSYLYDQLKNNCYREDPLITNVDHDFDDDHSPAFGWAAAHEISVVIKCRLVCRSWNKTIQDYYKDPKKPSGASHFSMLYDSDSLIPSIGRFNDGTVRYYY